MRTDVINKDCIDHLKELPNDSFDLIIADPPYFQIYGDFDFVWESVDQYLDWAKTWIKECHRVLKPTGTFYLWGSMGINNGYPLPKLADWIENEKLFIVQNWITQRNSRGRGTKHGYMQAREELVYMTKSEDYTWNTAYTDQRSERTDCGFDGKNEFMRCSDVWIDIAEASQSQHQRFKTSDGKAFPTVKAIRLCERIIRASSNPGDKVYIPFGGSGSEAVACKMLDRQFVITEKNPEYVNQIIIPRLESVTPTCNFA
jgi:site-specific DNA-methyltransferase (adenine-specific)